MAVSADELNGYRRDRYFARSWALLTMEKGWWKPVLIMALFGLIPVIGILALVGYALETARVTAWGINAGPKQKDFKFGTYIVTGLKAVVIALAFGLAYSIATGILSFIPVINLILIPVFIVAAFVYPLFINVIQVRAAVYGNISAGFAFKNIFEMIKHDMGGLFRIFGMGIVLGIATSIIMGIIGGSAAISMFVNIGTQAVTIARTQNVTSQQQLGLIMLALLARGFIQMGPIFLAIGYIGHVVGLIVMLLLQNAIALWMRQFNVAAWGQSNDPLPPFINDPRDGAAATYAAPAPVAPTAPAATAAPAVAPVAVPVAAPAPTPAPTPSTPVYEKVLTTYVDENGELIIPDENGSHPRKSLEGYEIVRTETDANGNVRNVYRKVQSQTPVQPVEPATPAMPEQPAKPEVPATPAAVKEAEGKRELPNTGTEDNASLAALGLLGVLSGFGLVARKKKED